MNGPDKNVAQANENKHERSKTTWRVAFKRTWGTKGENGNNNPMPTFAYSQGYLRFSVRTRLGFHKLESYGQVQLGLKENGKI